MSDDFVEPCCDDELCEGCKDKFFTVTFYFDNHQILIKGCPDACGEIENILGNILQARIPKVKEHA